MATMPELLARCDRLKFRVFATVVSGEPNGIVFEPFDARWTDEVVSLMGVLHKLETAQLASFLVADGRVQVQS